mgnify:CR=1 FL=1
MHEHVITPLNEDCPPKGGFCRTHELNIQLLAALYAVSRVLSRSLDYNETLRDVLRVLHDEAGMTRGLLSVLDPVFSDPATTEIYTPCDPLSLHDAPLFYLPKDLPSDHPGASWSVSQEFFLLKTTCSLCFAQYFSLLCQALLKIFCVFCSEDRRVGNDCHMDCPSRWSTYHYNEF